MVFLASGMHHNALCCPAAFLSSVVCMDHLNTQAEPLLSGDHSAQCFSPRTHSRVTYTQSWWNKYHTLPQVGPSTTAVEYLITSCASHNRSSKQPWKHEKSNVRLPRGRCKGGRLYKDMDTWIRLPKLLVQWFFSSSQRLAPASDTYFSPILVPFFGALDSPANICKMERNQ